MSSPASGRVAVLAAALLLTTLGGCASPAGPDPWEKMNRGIFAFNEGADRWLVGPVAKGWDTVAPDFAQTGLENFFDNLKAPLYVGNNILQGEFEHAYLELWHFVLNSTVGIAGFIDVAGKAGWSHNPEDFGLTLGHWGVPNGPYLVLPILGASTVRDTGGLVGDALGSVYGWFAPIYIGVAVRATELLNRRAIYYEEIAQSREEAFDFYVFVRSAYLQHRAHRLAGGGGRDLPPGALRPLEDAAADDDLYYFEEDEYSEDEDEDEDGDEE